MDAELEQGDSLRGSTSYGVTTGTFVSMDEYIHYVITRHQENSSTCFCATAPIFELRTGENTSPTCYCYDANYLKAFFQNKTLKLHAIKPGDVVPKSWNNKLQQKLDVCF